MKHDVDHSRRRLLTLLAISPVLMVPHTSRAASDDVLQTYRKRYASLKSISFTFNSPSASGTLQARKGGKHRIKLADRTLVSDGATVWNAVTTSKTVIIEPVKRRAGETTLDQIFFMVFSAYNASVVSTSANDGVIRLTPPDETMRIGNIDKIDLHLTKSGTVTSIVVYEGTNVTTWKISALKVNPSLKESTFTFTVPADWKVVDLR